MLKKEPIIIEFETPIDQQNFINWAMQPSNPSNELNRVKEIQRKVKAARTIQAKVMNQKTSTVRGAVKLTSSHSPKVSSNIDVEGTSFTRHAIDGKIHAASSKAISVSSGRKLRQPSKKLVKGKNKA